MIEPASSTTFYLVSSDIEVLHVDNTIAEADHLSDTIESPDLKALSLTKE